MREGHYAMAERERMQNEIDELKHQLEQCRQDLATAEEHHHWLVSTQRKRMERAEKLWRDAHNQPDTYPDLGDLIEWLVQRGDDALDEAKRLPELKQVLRDLYDTVMDGEACYEDYGRVIEGPYLGNTVKPDNLSVIAARELLRELEKETP